MRKLLTVCASMRDCELPTEEGLSGGIIRGLFLLAYQVYAFIVIWMVLLMIAHNLFTIRDYQVVTHICIMTGKFQECSLN